MTYLIYGANGYMGELIARAARERGHSPILAGRNPREIQALARSLDLPARIFELHEPAVLDENLKGVVAVLHCAGPFAQTAQPMVEACLRARVHYLDIAGDPLVLESLAQRDREARERDVMLLPGAGFDVVPTDCLALHLKRQLSTADTLVLAFHGVQHHSRGSSMGAIERLGRPGLLRRAGRLTPFRPGSRVRMIDFGSGPQHALGIAWGDVCTAFHSTAIPNIEVFAGAPAAARHALRVTGLLHPVLQSAPAQRYLKNRLKARPKGPTAEQRALGRTLFWGEASDRSGRRVQARVTAPEAYALTTLTALAAMTKVLAGTTRPGFQTPSQLFGADFSLEIPGVVRCDA